MARNRGKNNKRFVKVIPKDNIKTKKNDNETIDLKEEFTKDLGDQDYLFGFDRITEGDDRVGWLINMHPTETLDETIGVNVSAVDYYFIEQDGSTFKVTIHKFPYIYIDVPSIKINEVESYLKTKYSKYIYQTVVGKKENLEVKNHLFGVQKQYIKIEFRTISDLLHVRGLILPFVTKNWEKIKNSKDQNSLEYEFYGDDITQNGSDNEDNDDNDDAYTDLANSDQFETYLQRRQAQQQKYQRQQQNEHEKSKYSSNSKNKQRNPFEYIVDIREYDIPFYMRCAIDMNVRVGYWYQIQFKGGKAKMTHREDLLARGEPRVLAFDIETTKLPLKFPDPSFDSIMMISYMIDGQGYLIINRQCVSEDIEDFEYTPKPEYEGPFQIFNEKDELALIKRFFLHIQQVKPNIYVTFNGDFFDWPFIQARANFHSINMTKEIGVYNQDDEYKCRFASHMDAYKWVQRDSYLPHGSHGLKAVTKAKLGYDPVEIDPEDMVKYAMEKPQLMASYSVSDAVATYYLYMKYVHPFIFSLCSIIPMNPDDVLRKGSGTLCESLLMVQAYQLNIIFPNKQVTAQSKFHNGHLLESETYIGGHVEALESGVFRSDLPVRFDLDAPTLESLISRLDDVLNYTIEEEGKFKKEHIANFDQVKGDIFERLNELCKNPKNRKEKPNIYHLDVAAMYPNIILTNRLQPSAIVNEEICAACEFNHPKNNCKRWMTWNWRGDYIPANKSEYSFILSQLESEKFPSEDDNGRLVNYSKLPEFTKQTILVKRLKEYSRKVYKKAHVLEAEERKACVCQRENSFYVDTVRAFRDRRYKFKDDLKYWKTQLDRAIAESNLQEIQKCKNMLILYDSLQLAHKCILNSFYGYVMRRGARWFSMEMAGIVTTYGAQIIKEARKLIEGIGRPLELDTDGIWTLLPQTFPENYKFQILPEFQHLYDRSSFIFSFPCVMLNHTIKLNFSNNQYQNLVDKSTHEYQTISECSILFEVDGPYAAMVLPSSVEEGKKLKKRYAVFNHDKTLAELKGFEIKRRGELKLIKIFQSQVFEHFLEGTSLEECYQSVAKIADYWLDMLYSKGENMEDDELISLISCSNNMSRSLSEYENHKTTAIVTAKRLSEFLGDQILKDNSSSGLQCKFIISSSPAGASIVERAIPVAIFAAETPIKNHYLKKWLKDPNFNSVSESDDLYNIRDILDWDYYIKRLASTVQKIITIPAAIQSVDNPVSRIPHPQWLLKKLESARNQSKITFKSLKPSIMDIENIADEKQPKKPVIPIVSYFKKASDVTDGTQPSSSTSQSNSKSKKRRRSLTDQESEDLHLIQSTPLPDSEKDYSGWLSWLKAKWRVQRNQRKRIKHSTFASPSSLGLPPNKRRATHQLVSASSSFGSSGNYFQEQRNILYNMEWHIIQIAEIANSPGQFRIWCLVENNLFPILISIPRIFYIHSNQRNPNNIEQSIATLQKIERTLPHSKPLKHLYQFTFNEFQYQKAFKDIQNISNHSEVEGVYEENVYPLFRAILQFGAICKVDHKVRSLNSKSKSEPFQYNQLIISPQKTHNYLTGKNFRLAYLYASFTEQRAVYSLTFENTRTAHIYIVAAVSQANNASSILQLKKSFYSALYPDETANNEVTDDQLKSFNFHIQFFKQKENAFKKLNRNLWEYKQQRPAPTIIVIQSTNDLCSASHWITSSCPKIRDFPYVTLNFNEKDNIFAAFGWELNTCKLIGRRWNEAKKTFNRLTEYCNDFQVPIGNLPKDFLLFSSDVIFSRLLQKQKHLLWVSESTLPDLGNRFISHFASFSTPKKALIENNQNESKEIDTSLLNKMGNMNYIEDDSGEYIERIKSGCYTTMTIEIQLRNLAINSILVSQHVNDIEDFLQSNSKMHFITKDDQNNNNNNSSSSSSSSSSTFSSDNKNEQPSSNFDEFSFTFDEKAVCYRTFRVLKQLVHQWLAHNSTSNFEVLKEHLYRWISSPKSLLFDPALHNLIKDLMKKIFFHLLAEFRKLGATVIFANFNQVTISTSKTNEEDAKTYIEFILKVIKSRSIFQYLELDVKNYWEVYLFSDEANLAGVSIGSKEVYNQWNVEKYLPISVQPNFSAIISSYLSQLHQHYYHNPNNNSSNNLSPQTHVNIVKNTISQRLYNLVHDMQRSVAPSDEDPTKQFPKLAGSYLSNLRSPSLEFVKNICHVLSLDRSLSSEIIILRKNLMKLTNSKEFSSEAEYRNPSLSFILPDIICNYCSDVRNIDLLRDPYIMNGQWECLHCHNEYNKSYFEKLLVDFLHKKSMTYQTQDLLCSRCNAVKENNTTNHCSICSSPFKLSTPSLDVVSTVRIINSIAKFHKFEWLEETSNWYLSLS